MKLNSSLGPGALLILLGLFLRFASVEIVAGSRTVLSGSGSEFGLYTLLTDLGLILEILGVGLILIASLAKALRSARGVPPYDED